MMLFAALVKLPDEPKDIYPIQQWVASWSVRELHMTKGTTVSMKVQKKVDRYAYPVCSTHYNWL